MPTLRRAALRFAFALATSLLAGAACLSPTLPLPPPEPADTMRPSDAEGKWLISGNCTPGARVSVFNERTQRGVIEDDVDGNGRFGLYPVAPARSHHNDLIEHVVVGLQHHIKGGGAVQDNFLSDITDIPVYDDRIGLCDPEAVRPVNGRLGTRGPAAFGYANTD